ncbi:MAG: NAD(P)-dependent oxidoreductase [Promethearchaeati archaeon SRVP18_Atabeyarchaeia-1]
MSWKALIVAPFSNEGLTLLKKYMTVTYENWKETNKLYTDSRELAERIQRGKFNIIICEGDNVDEELINKCDLKIIACCRANPINIDVDAATKRNVPVIYTPARNADSVADLTIGLMIAQARHMTLADRLLRSGQIKVETEEEMIKSLERFSGVELGLRTVGIIGFGAIGYRVAKRLRGFGSKILVYDPFIEAGDPRPREVGATVVTKLDTLMKESDFVTLHVAALPETDKLISRELIGMMKSTSYFINTSRGFCVDEDALFESLKEKRIAGAGLDVFVAEPVESTNRFLDLDNVTVTPHIGGDTVDVVMHHSEMIATDIERIIKGKKPNYLKNPDVLSAGKIKKGKPARRKK